MQISLSSRYVRFFVFFQSRIAASAAKPGGVHLIAEREAQVAQMQHAALGFREIFRIAEQLVGVQHHERVQPADVVLAALARRRLGADDVERAQVEEDRPAVVEAPRDADRERKRALEELARRAVAARSRAATR